MPACVAFALCVATQSPYGVSVGEVPAPPDTAQASQGVAEEVPLPGVLRMASAVHEEPQCLVNHAVVHGSVTHRHDDEELVEVTAVLADAERFAVSAYTHVHGIAVERLECVEEVLRVDP